jgi:hypothetical protein
MAAESIILGVFAVWLLALSLVFAWIYRCFARLTKGVKKGNLVKVLDKILASEGKSLDEIRKLEKEVGRLEEASSLHVQKVGLVRFNPFKELGGEHSFAAALLDGKENGLILTGLHTRDRTRLYIKSIERGKSKHKLSEEEKKALAKALK